MGAGSPSSLPAHSFLDPATPYQGNKKILFVINPASGNKQGRKIFSHVVRPLCEQHKIQFEVIETVVELFEDPSVFCQEAGEEGGCSCGRRQRVVEGSPTEEGKNVDENATATVVGGRGGRARKAAAANADFRKVFSTLQTSGTLLGIVTLGGDGTLYEMLNFLRGKEGVDVGGLRFGIVPCGTSDGLCTSIFDRRKEAKEFEVMQHLARGVRGGCGVDVGGGLLHGRSIGE